MNFVNALERLPEIIRQHEDRTEKMRKDVPLFEANVAKPWGKEEELKGLKSELAVLDRKITALLAPQNEKLDFGEDVKREESPEQSVKIMKSDTPQKEQIGNSSMVAEPVTKYNTTDSPLRQFTRF